MKRFVWVSLAILIIAALTLGACAQPAAPAPGPGPTPTPAPAGPTEIVIGINAPLTGMHAGFGEGNVWGEKAAVEDINKLGGVEVKEYGRKIPIRLSIVDNESDQTKAMSLSEDLILRDKVNFMVDPNQPIPLAIPEATVAERYKIPRVSGGTPMEPWLGARSATSPTWDHNWTYTLSIATPAPKGSVWDKPGYTIMDQWIGVLKMIADKTNKKVAVFASDEPDGIGWYQAIPSVLGGQGFDTFGVEKKLGLFPMETTDFSSMITQWKDYNCEILWGNCPAPLFGTLWKQARGLGYHPKVVNAVRAHLFYDDVVAWGGDLPLGISGDSWWAPTYDSKVCPGIGGTTPMSLFERWNKETGKALNPGIGWGYHSIQILANAIERAGSLDGEKVNKALGETNMATISSPNVRFDENHSCPMPAFYTQWQKTDKPWKWECPTILSYHGFIPVEAKQLFPVP